MHCRYDGIFENQLEPGNINTDFRESIIDKSIRRLPQQYVQEYRAILVPDNDFETTKKQLIRRIITLTKAAADKSVIISDYLATQEEKIVKNKKFATEGVKSELTNYKIPLNKIKRIPSVKDSTAAAATDATANPARLKEDQYINDDEDYEEDPDDVMCRWKFAFRDLSKAARDANAPTMIRTRKGL